MPDEKTRRLGVIEAISATRDQCPSGAVRACAEGALEAIKRREPGVLREQAAIVFMAAAGWRGDRAAQVRESLQAFLDGSEEREAEREPGNEKATIR